MMSNERPSRVLFASCNSQHYEQTLWPVMNSRNATGFVWAGDAIYADDFEKPADQGIWKNHFPIPGFLRHLKVKPATPKILKELYAEQLENVGYRDFLQQSVSVVLGAMDDHDYGANNGDKNYPHKVESASYFVQFLRNSTQIATAEAEKSSAAETVSTPFRLMEKRAAAGRGMYGVKVLDFTRPLGQELLTDEESAIDPDLFQEMETDSSLPAPQQLSEKSVAIFMLDVRSHKTPWESHWYRKFLLDYEADFLGQEQWQWLEQALRRSTARVNILINGLQIHADRFFDGNHVENWSVFPASQHKLYQTILSSGISAPILVSGDVHMAELSRKDCRKATQMDKPPDTRMLLELTTSGLTHSWGTKICARPNCSQTCRMPYLDWSLKMGMHWGHWNQAWRDIVDIPSRSPNYNGEGAKTRYQYALDLNFGEMEFDWDNNQVIVRVFGPETRADGSAKPMLSTRWDMDTLSGRSSHPLADSHVTPAQYRDKLESLKAKGALFHTNEQEQQQGEEWICLPYRGSQPAWLTWWGFFSSVSLAGFIMSLPVMLPILVLWCLVARRLRKRSGGSSRKKILSGSTNGHVHGNGYHGKVKSS